MIPAIVMTAAAPLAWHGAMRLTRFSKQIDPERVAYAAWRSRGMWLPPLDDDLPEKQRRDIARENGWTCHYGDGDLHLLRLGPDVDHKVPVNLGGSDDPENLVPCCGKHRREKGSRNYTAFRLQQKLDPELRECGK